MDLKNDIILKRYSVRKYTSRKIEDNKLMSVLDAGRLAASAANFQPWHFIVVRNPDNLEKIYTVYNRDWIRSAPTVILICADHNLSWKRSLDGKDSADIDAAISVDHMTLQATALGMGTCWVCNFDAKKCSELFKLPSNLEPIVILPIGYADMESPIKKRKSINDIVSWENYQKTTP